jgi:AraC-like DNA-binding protein
MNTLTSDSHLSFNWYLLFVLLGIFQALFLGVVIFMKGRRSGNRFKYLGLLILSLGIILIEVFLNYSGYITQMIHIHKFSFPIQFLIAPSLFLFIKGSLQTKLARNSWVHFIPFAFFLLYFMLYYVQDGAVKYNLRIEENGLNLEKLPVESRAFYDPLRIHHYFHFLVFVQLLFYAYLIWRELSVRYRKEAIKLFNSQRYFLNQYRNLLLYYLLAILIMAWLLIRYFWLGDYIFSLYLTVILYLISINISYRSLNEYFRNRQSVKYASSNLDFDEKTSILDQIRKVAEDEGFYCKGNASLDALSGQIKVSKHNVSQVINEMLGKSFFEYLAELRISKAKELLSDQAYQNVTIDEISFLVGYNSRSAFNRVFKSITSTTPAEYRRTNT